MSQNGICQFKQKASVLSKSYHFWRKDGLIDNSMQLLTKTKLSSYGVRRKGLSMHDSVQVAFSNYSIIAVAFASQYIRNLATENDTYNSTTFSGFWNASQLPMPHPTKPSPCRPLM